jgi:hypothetical protein
MERRVALYFVASPLQYLAARRIAERFETGARQVLAWYKRGVAPVVRREDWDASAYMAWPRWEPLPGPFGRLARLRANIREIAALVGPCDSLHIHSAVFDTEAINYFLRALPDTCGARTMRARILPDGIVSVRRYPLSPLKVAAQYARKLRRLVAPELDYWRFTGDRIGSDAPFCDRIYVLPGLPHEYPAHKVVVLPPLVDAPPASHETIPRRALVIGQPLVGAGLMRAADRDAVSKEIRDWLFGQGITEIHYKGHPKDPHRELCEPEYRMLDIDEPLEVFMSHSPYEMVAGVRSSALVFARQLRPTSTRVLSFGFDALRFKSEAEKDAMTKTFTECSIEIRRA